MAAMTAAQTLTSRKSIASDGLDNPLTKPSAMCRSLRPSPPQLEKGELARLPIMPALLGTKPPLNDRQTTLAKARVLASLWHRVILRRLSATRGGSRLPTTAVPTSSSIPTSAQRLGLLYHSPNWLRVSSPPGSCSRIDFGFSLALF